MYPLVFSYILGLAMSSHVLCPPSFASTSEPICFPSADIDDLSDVAHHPLYPKTARLIGGLMRVLNPFLFRVVGE